MKNTDTRIQVTKAMFHQTMLELLEEKAIGFISVKELCDRAGVNRGTFYLHYAAPVDVLHEMEETVKSSVIDSFSVGLYEELLASLQKVFENRRLVAAVIGHNGNPEFLKGVRDMVYQKAESQLLQMYPQSTPLECRCAFDYVYSGSTGLVTVWLQDETPEPTEQFARRLERLNESVFNTLKAE